MANQKITVTLTANDTATPQLQKFNTQLDQTDRKSKDLGGAGGGFDSMAKGLNSLVAGFGLAQFGQVVSDLNKIGTEASGMEQIFVSMAGGVGQANNLLGQLQKTTSNVVSDFDLMAGASQLMRMGLANNADEVNNLISMAVKLKKPTDSAAEAIDNFSLMLANQSVMRLDSFGISSGKVRDRINELLETGKALNREEAFTMAVMEQGALAVERLGSAADISNTSLNRLQTRFENLRAEMGKFVATGIEAGAQIAEIGAMGFESAGDGSLNDFITAAAIATISEVDPSLGGDLAQRHTEIMNERNRSNTVVSPNAVSGRIVNSSGNVISSSDTGVIDPAHFSNMWEVERGLWENALGGLGSAGGQALDIFRGIPSQLATSPDSQFANAQRYFSSMSTNVTSGQGNMGLMTPDAISAAINGYAQMQGYAEDIRNNPFVPDGAVEKIDALVERAKVFAGEAEAAKAAFENMSLDQMLGRGDGGRAGELSDMVLGNLDEEARGDVQQDFDLATGRESELGIAVEQDIAPQLAEITQRFGSEVGIKSMEAALNAIEQGQVMGHTDAQIASAAQFGAVQQLPMFQDMMGTVGGVGEFLGGMGEGGLGAMFGMGGDEEGGGGILPNIDGAIESIGQIEERLGVLSEVATTVTMDGVVDSSSQIVGMLDEAAGLLDSLAEDREVTVKVNIVAGDVDPEAEKALGKSVKNITSNNGGMIPE